MVVIFSSLTLPSPSRSSVFISYRAGFVYLSDLFKDDNAYILEVGSSETFNDTNQLGETTRAGDTAKILVSDLPPDYTIDDVKWKIYWMDWQKDETEDGFEGDQYSENPVMTFEESTQTLTARRMGMEAFWGRNAT